MAHLCAAHRLRNTALYVSLPLTLYQSLSLSVCLSVCVSLSISFFLFFLSTSDLYFSPYRFSIPLLFFLSLFMPNISFLFLCKFPLCRLCVNFINILCADFTCANPKSAKRQLNCQSFCTFGICARKI